MPTVTFFVSASGDDATMEDGDAAYPPPGPAVVLSADTTMNPSKGLSGTYILGVSCMRWDTSSIPDDATVTAATFRARGTGKVDADARSITLEWYDMVTADAADYTTTVGTNANAGRTITSLSASADEDFTLLNPAANINLSGYTGLRMHVSGGVPAGVNYWLFATFDHATLDAPRLIVTYEEFQGSAVVAWMGA